MQLPLSAINILSSKFVFNYKCTKFGPPWTAWNQHHMKVLFYCFYLMSNHTKDCVHCGKPLCTGLSKLSLIWCQSTSKCKQLYLHQCCEHGENSRWYLPKIVSPTCIEKYTNDIIQVFSLKEWAWKQPWREWQQRCIEGIFLSLSCSHKPCFVWWTLTEKHDWFWQPLWHYGDGFQVFGQ